jgi:glycosyltransferase involved in cell wall biosynthesis
MPSLIVFSHLRWNFVQARPQHLLARLSVHYPVLYVEEPLYGPGPARLERATPADGIELLRPRTPLGIEGFHDDQIALIKPLLVQYLAQRQIDDYVCWFYTPMAQPLGAALAPRALVYDCMEEWSARRDCSPELRRRELRLLQEADLVLAGGPSLYAAKQRFNPHLLCLPSAVDADHFAPEHALADQAAVERAEQLHSRIGRPRLGFFGIIDGRVDTALIGKLADAEPEWEIVMVGPVQDLDPLALPYRRNIHWLGRQPYELLPQLVAQWDVCLLPYLLNDSTRFLSPTKTLEYLAAEKPVVSTAVQDVLAMYGEVVHIGGDASSFVEACQRALSETGHKRAERMLDMVAMVSRFSWDRSAQCIVEALQDLLAPPLASSDDDVDATHAAKPAQRVPSALADAEGGT